MCYLYNVYKSLTIKPIRRRPKKYYLSDEIYSLCWVAEHKDLKHPKIDYTYKDLTEDFVLDAISSVCDYINNRHDCSDFRLLSLLFFKLEAQDFLNKAPRVEKKLFDTFINFKFWIKQNGYDSLCYYSENHLISFATIEYILGKLYPNEIFTNDNKTGLEHQSIASKRILDWFELRNRFGFSEFYSNNYLPINLGVLVFLIRYSENDEFIKKSINTCNILLMYYGSTLFNNTFINANGRDYPRNIMNCDDEEPNSAAIINPIWGDTKNAIYGFGGTADFFTFMVTKNDVYQVPKEIIELAKQKTCEVKASFGLDLKDYKKEGLYGLEDKSLMMQLGSGALTNPEIIENTLNMVHKYDLWRNDFLSWLRLIENPLLRVLHLMPLASKTLDYFMNGMSLGKANIYTYRNEYYKLSSLQNYYPSSSGAQKHTIIATLDNGVTVFTNHPLRIDKASEKSPQFTGDRSPSYFGGYGFAPCAYQHQNVALVEYRIPMFRKTLSKYPMLHFTHAFLPEELFDEVEVIDNYAFARINKSYIALIGKNKLEYLPFDAYLAQSARGKLKDTTKHFDLIQKGRKSYWIYELSDAENETYEDFKARIKNNKVSYINKTLRYESTSVFEAKYAKEFKVDGKLIDTNYNGYNSDSIVDKDDGVYIFNKKIIEK